MESDTRAIYTFREGDMFDNRYRLVRRVGSGGFADVWQAEDTLRRNKIVALKIYTRLDEEGIKEMSDQYNETEEIKHPNLLTGKHFGAVGNIPYLEMRYCAGGSLAQRVGSMSHSELHHMLREICSGLAYLHNEGIVHQDIKPDNILFDTDTGCNRFLLADFGISSKIRTRLSKSVNKANMSLSMTEAYAPPEKFSGNLSDIEPDTKGDIFSLGMTLYELVVGQLPFTPPMATGREMLYSQGRLRLDCSKIADKRLRTIVQRCTQYRKKDRPTAKEILFMLDGNVYEEKQKHVSFWKKITLQKLPINITELFKSNLQRFFCKFDRKWLYPIGALVGVLLALSLFWPKHPAPLLQQDSIVEVDATLNKQTQQNKNAPKPTSSTNKKNKEKPHNRKYQDIPIFADTALNRTRNR